MRKPKTDAAPVQTQRSKLTENRPLLEFIPPLSKDFVVYGGPDTVERARAWAVENRVLLVRGLPNCAHGFYMMASCPRGSACHDMVHQFDHVNLWIHSELGQPFLLFHPYSEKVDEATEMYARAHGLDITSYDFDGWYHERTIPIRMSVPSGWPVWPLEAAAHTMLITQPVSWPDEEVP